MLKIGKIWILAALCAALAVGGCASDGSPGTPDYIFDEDDFGTLDARDEEPLFGDSEVAMGEIMFSSAYGEDQDDFEDAFESAVTALEENPGVRVFLVRLAWGILTHDPENDVVTDFSGSVEIDTGGMRVLRTILFEWGLGDQILERTARELVEWSSHTRGHFDGLLLRAVVLPEERSPQFRVTVGDFTRDYTLDELAGLEEGEVVAYDEIGNIVSICAFELGLCPSGFMSGLWARIDGAEGGGFRGKFTGPLGAVYGVMAGYYEPLEFLAGGVFYGKLIDGVGGFAGFVRGRYIPFGPGFSAGSMHGEWVDRWGYRQGLIGGHYAEGESGWGYFQGGWIELCED